MRFGHYRCSIDSKLHQLKANLASSNEGIVKNKPSFEAFGFGLCVLSGTETFLVEPLRKRDKIFCSGYHNTNWVGVGVVRVCVETMKDCLCLGANIILSSSYEAFPSGMTRAERAVSRAAALVLHVFERGTGMADHYPAIPVNRNFDILHDSRRRPSGFRI